MRVLFRASPSKRRGPSRHHRHERCHLSSRRACRTSQASTAFIRATPRDRRQQAVARTHGAGLRVVISGPPLMTYARIPPSARLSSGFLRMTKARNPRDGLLKAITPSPRVAQRSSPNDSRKGSNSRALTAFRESWVNDSRDQALPRGSAIATPSKRRCGAGEQHNNRTKREGVSRCSQQSLGSLRRPQASSNTYPNGLTPRQQMAALWRFVQRSMKGHQACAGNESITATASR